MSILHPRAGRAGSWSAGLGQVSRVEHHGHVRGLLAVSGVGRLGAPAVPKLLGLKEKKKKRGVTTCVQPVFELHILSSAQGLSEDKVLFERIT